MRKALLAATVALGLLVVFVVGTVFYLSWSACLGGERAALTGFPHYAELESGPSPLMGACQVRYTTQASRKEVLGYYEEHLRKSGWHVLGYMTVGRPPKSTEWPVKKLSRLSEVPESAGGSLTARRGNYNYMVSYESPSKEDPDIPDDKALVISSVIEKGGKPGAFRD
jgi:hypothetical protein